MKSKKTLEIGEDRADDVEIDATESVDDFIRELEAKEKDLCISPELVIEVSESDFDDTNIPDFISEELTTKESKSIEMKTAAPRASQSRLKNEISELETTLSKFKAERTEILERARRQKEDFESYRNRVERERRESFSGQMVNLAGQMLPVLDNLNRALDYAMAMEPEKRAEIAPFFDGIVLVNQQVNDVLSGMGLQPIAAVGAEFDPYYHEAVATEPADSQPPNTVTEELLRGYRIGAQVIRHSMVKVATGSPNAADQGSGDETGNDSDVEPNDEPGE
jgi:molecular chaperone GrpE